MQAAHEAFTPCAVNAFRAHLQGGRNPKRQRLSSAARTNRNSKFDPVQNCGNQKSMRTKAPSHLQRATRAWFLTVLRDYQLEPHHIRLLTLAAEAWDRHEQARAEIERDGLTVPTANGLKTHPAIAIERDARLAFARLVRELDLSEEAPPSQHASPPGLRSNRRGGPSAG
ncbi:MAG: P27 family phage terminase small subunit [Methyloceanibacter sp.]